MGTDRSNGLVCVLALLVFAACDDRVIEVSGSGSSGSGANSASSGDATLPSSVAPPSSPPTLQDIVHGSPGAAQALSPHVQRTTTRRLVRYDCD